MKEKDNSGIHEIKNPLQNFLTEVTIVELNPEYFEKGAAYLCTPLDYPSQKFIGIFEDGDTKEIHFITATFGSATRKTIAANDASNWKIEKMVLPFTDEEVDYMIRCMNLSTSDTVGLVAVFASMDAAKYKADIIKKLRG
jgi:hypothetical protein